MWYVKVKYHLWPNSYSRRWQIQIRLIVNIFYEFSTSTKCQMNTLPTGNRNIRTMYETCSKLTIKTLERVVLVSLLLTLSRFQSLFWCCYLTLNLLTFFVLKRLNNIVRFKKKNFDGTSNPSAVAMTNCK